MLRALGFIALFLCLGALTYAQRKLDFLERLRVPTLHQLEVGSIADGTQITDIFSRGIDFGYTQSIVSIEKWTGKKRIPYTYLLIAKSDSIIFGRLFYTAIDFETEKRVADVVRDNKEIISLVAAHNRYYHTQLEVDGYLETASKLVMVGTGCFYEGMPMKTAIELKKAVSKRDTTTIDKWLTAPNMEIQFYAVLGLKCLEQMGSPLTEKKKVVIQHILDREAKINYCSGCIDIGFFWNAKELFESGRGQWLVEWFRK